MLNSIKKNLFLLSLIIASDLGTKFFFTQLFPDIIHYNQGFFLGNLAQSSSLFRIIALGSSAAFISFIYFVQIYILPTHLVKLRLAITLLVGGILGNVIDRIHDGRTVDFIPFSLFNFSASFNIADVFLVCGAIFILYLVFFKDKEIWHPNSSRSKFIVMPNHQYRIASYFGVSALFFCLIVGTFCFSFLQNQIPGYILRTNGMGDLFYVLFASQAFLYIIASFYFGLLITHKTYGPIYAFISYVKARTDDSKSTRGEKLRLRSGDYFKELEDLADKIDSAIDN